MSNAEASKLPLHLESLEEQPSHDRSKINWDFTPQGQGAGDFWFYPFCVMEKMGVRKIGDEPLFLYSRVAALGPGNYANLGDFRGTTAIAFAWALRDHGYKGRVYTVDLWDQKCHRLGRYPKRRFRCFSEYMFYWAGLRNPCYNDDENGWIKMCWGRTDDWGERLKRGKHTFRCIFIDADHSYEWCKKDFEIWSTMLDEDGELIFHDCHTHGVNKVIEELDPEWKMTHHILTTKVFKRA
jgi:predicted O-methyltransferase YrrM